MILSIYLARKFFKSLFICVGMSLSIFFIFSLIGNLGENFSFKSIIYISTLNSLQIFTYIPSHLFILTLCLFIMHLKSKNELIVIKEYVAIRKLFLLIMPILTLFIFIEIEKDNYSINIEEKKLDLLSSKKNFDTKILISSNGDKKNYFILRGYDEDKKIINQFLSFESQNQKINKGEISNNLNLFEEDLISIKSIIYENDDFRNEDIEKKLFKNFLNYFPANTGKIIKNNESNINSNYNFVQLILFNILFYFCVSMIFFSKKIVNRDMNSIKVFLLVLSIFLYFLLIPKVMLNNFQYIFQFFSILIFILIFFKIKKYE